MDLRTLTEPSPIDPYFDRWSKRPDGVGCTLAEYRTLFSLAANLQPRSILEIGPGCGASTMAFLLGSTTLEQLTQVTIHPDGCTEVVEPQFLPRVTTRVMTSDNFFEQLAPDVRFDLVFVDGDHRALSAARDITNALHHLQPAGVIVCHDILPTCLGDIGVIAQDLAGRAGKQYTALVTGGPGLGIIS